MVTLAFAGVMAILLAVIGIGLYLSFKAQLDETINSEHRRHVRVRAVAENPFHDAAPSCEY